MIRPLIALDIGSTKVACAIGLPHEHAAGFELLGSSLVSYPMSSERSWADPLMVGQVIEQALEATAVSGDFYRALVAVSHPSLSSEHVQAAVPLADEPIAIRAQDVDRLRRRALDQGVSIDREPLLVESLGFTGNGFDGARDPHGLPATRLRGTFHIITAPVAVRRAIVQAVESAGLEVEQLSYVLPAVLAGAADETLHQQRVLLLDAGGLVTDIGLVVEGLLRAAAIVPQGTVTLASLIGRDVRMTMDQAVALSLQGMTCRKPAVREAIERHWTSLQESISGLLTGHPKPDVLLLSGRGALIDGFAEWVERHTEIPVRLCRSPRTSGFSDVARQVGITPAIGVLEMATRASNGAVRSPHLFNRLIDRTRSILTEYF